MGNFKKFILVISGLALMVLFQNCGDELNLTEIQNASVSSAPSVSILAPAAYIENSDSAITAIVSNLPNATLSWYKDSVELIGETANALNFNPLSLTDSGIYEVRATDGNTTVVSSTVITVTADPNAPTTQSFSEPRFLLNGQNYYIYTFAAQTPVQRMMNADSFCKGMLGANSIALSYTLKAQAQLTQRYAYAAEVATCNMNTFRQGYLGGYCLAFLSGANLQLQRYQTVECQL